MAEQWIEASSALRIAGNHLSLCSRLHAGLVVARAAKLKMDDQEQLQALVGKAFWWAEGHEALEQDWVSGLFLAFSSDTPPRFIDAFPCSLAPASRTGAATMERLAYSINDTARTLSLGRTSIYAMIADGRLEAFKLGRRTLIRADSIRRLVAAQV